jgi:H+/Cl- antiporter ClcA
VQTTGSLAGWLARRRMLPVPDARILTITGMAAGFSVLFGAPLGSALFALEILHRRGLQYHEALLPAVWGALCGYVVSGALTVAGLRTIWTFPPATHVAGGDLLIGVAAGVAGALVATAFTYASHWARRLFRVFPAVARPLAGGLALGALVFASPYALTFGEGQISHVSVAVIATGTLVLALVAKFAATTLIGASGWRGGFIIPLFFMGVVLGSLGWNLFGVHRTVAMAACMVACNVGVTKTPLGSVVVVAEMAGLPILPPALVAALVALVLTSRVSMIETQREREGVFDAEAGHGDDRSAA